VARRRGVNAKQFGEKCLCPYDKGRKKSQKHNEKHIEEQREELSHMSK